MIYLLEKGINGEGESLLKVVNLYPLLASFLTNIEIIFKNDNLRDLYEILGANVFFQLAINYGETLTMFNSLDCMSLPNGEIDDYLKYFDDLFAQKIAKNKTLNLGDLPESIKNKFPFLFLKSDAPYELQLKFYEEELWGEYERLNLGCLKKNPEWKKHLMHLDFALCFKSIKVDIVDSLNDLPVKTGNLIEVLITKFTKEEILDLFIAFGYDIERNLSYYTIDISLTKEEILDKIYEHLYQNALRKLLDRSEDMPLEFKNKYPELFVNGNEDEKYINLFYSGKISIMDLIENTHWFNYLKDKKISVVVKGHVHSFVRSCETFGVDNDFIIELIQKYHKYIEMYEIDFYNFSSRDHNKIHKYIISYLCDEVINDYQKYDEDLKELVGTLHPDIFLDDGAPEELKNHYYQKTLTFALLKENRDWISYLKDKNLLIVFGADCNIRASVKELFERYPNNEEVIKIVTKNPETVMKMLALGKVELLCNWYEKLHFIPNYTVMLDFPFAQSDKFASSGKKWSQISRIFVHNQSEEAKSAILKASYVFGVFDNDIEGFNKLLNLFSGIPTKISEEHYSYVLEYIENLSYSSKEANKQKSLELKSLFAKAYVLKDGEYCLCINPQENKELVTRLHTEMIVSGIPCVLSPVKSHKLFGAFEMIYNPEFRDFLLENMTEILLSDEYISYISSMQKRWEEIKAWNKNRHLTLELALAFVKSNSYENVEVGNSLAAEYVGNEAYSEEEWDRLQEIYNYGKMRIFSSLPRVEGTLHEYTYEILRLDDPLALVIGKVTDCCQEIGNHAETCMEHSMVSKDGRIFVVRDLDGSIVAQSWVWRNQNVICFDNIEVPDRQMIAHGIPRGHEDSGVQNEFTDAVLDVYIKAAEKMIEEENEMYESLLKEGKITKIQYDSLKLSKVTVGLGYSNIKGSFKRLSKDIDLKRPKTFEPPVILQRPLYTNDSSETQYVLSGNKDVLTSNEDDIYAYSDTYKIYDDSNMTAEIHWILQKLEMMVKGFCDNTEIYNDNNIVTNIAYNCGLNPNYTRIVMNVNFAICYSINEGNIIIGDLYYNTLVTIAGTPLDSSNIVAMQIYLALEQIGALDNAVDVSNLNENQLQMYEKALSMKELIDKERGLTHGR